MQGDLGGQDGQTALVQRACDGDEVALAVLLTSTRARLLADMTIRMSPLFQGVFSAEDVVQEAHAEVFRRITTFQDRGTGSFYRWLATIALRRLRTAIAFHGAAKRSVAVTGRVRRSGEESSVALVELLSGSVASPSLVFSRTESASALREALKHLPDHYRHAVWAVYVDEQPVRSVAAELGCTERAVHGLCRRGLKQLRRVIWQDDSQRSLVST